MAFKDDFLHKMLVQVTYGNHTFLSNKFLGIHAQFNEDHRKDEKLKKKKTKLDQIFDCSMNCLSHEYNGVRIHVSDYISEEVSY